MANMDFKKYRVPVVKLLVVSLLVGMMLAFFDMKPEELLASLGDTVKSIFQVLVSLVEWMVPYVLLGAVVVIPIWVIMLVWRYFKSKSENQ
ncbi:MAG: DUF6460 domain-containing protein [Rhodospirillaceae bacterium]|nr:DUF6460 domain-containing protein [Rhodospirillaceae bacterium]